MAEISMQEMREYAGLDEPQPQGASELKAMLYDAAPELRDALVNMLGAFDNAARRLKYPSDFGDEAIRSAHDALERAGCPRRLVV